MKHLRTWLCAKLIPADVMVIGRGTWTIGGIVVQPGQELVGTGLTLIPNWNPKAIFYWVGTWNDDE